MSAFDTAAIKRCAQHESATLTEGNWVEAENVEAYTRSPHVHSHQPPCGNRNERVRRLVFRLVPLSLLLLLWWTDYHNPIHTLVDKMYLYHKSFTFPRNLRKMHKILWNIFLWVFLEIMLKFSKKIYDRIVRIFSGFRKMQ